VYRRNCRDFFFANGHRLDSLRRSFFAYGYEQAFEQLASDGLVHWPNRDYLHMPNFLLARHSIELNLKTTIQEVANRSTLEMDITGHGLLPLWRQLLSHRVSADRSIYIAHCGRLVEHFHDVDPDGERFRYPANKSGQQFPFTRIALAGLIKCSFFHISTLSDG
jgi:hypothetical protein